MVANELALIFFCFFSESSTNCDGLAHRPFAEFQRIFARLLQFTYQKKGIRLKNVDVDNVSAVNRDVQFRLCILEKILNTDGDHIGLAVTNHLNLGSILIKAARGSKNVQQRFGVPKWLHAGSSHRSKY